MVNTQEILICFFCLPFFPLGREIEHLKFIPDTRDEKCLLLPSGGENTFSSFWTKLRWASPPSFQQRWFLANPKGANLTPRDHCF